MTLPFQTGPQPVTLTIHGYANGGTEVTVSAALETICPTCKGSGEVYLAEWKAWMERHPEAPAQLIQEMTPEARESMPTRDTEVCGGCAGEGVKPTDLGRQILRFVRRKRAWL